MKTINSEAKTNSSGVPYIEYTLDTGYKFLSYPDDEIADTLWTKKGKPVKPDSVTFKRAEASVNKFVNVSSSKL
ncbi:hypothetical protein UFOVP148_23 [uncultured Caudovirales phage]|uniref:Uncharacterized protein n=1 Tax=uncultured Caudovirales phage TaxID=2100421 RepID=A0A6J7WC22_9CAUD|nr:hypothetical protein UFOVP148_23 [uncultured Caudovirales phage]